jgi:glycosyltransferase involved in cell wall biosynthesis
VKIELSEKIRIVHLVTNLESHGAERVLAKIVTASNPEKITHYVVSMKDVGPVGEYLRSMGIVVIALRLPSPAAIASAPFHFAAMLRRVRPHILHCWMYHANLFGALIGKVASQPYIIWSLRASNTHMEHYSLITRSIVRQGGHFSRWADMIIVNSEAGQQLHRSWGYEADKMKFIPNGFDLNRFKPDMEARASLRSELGIHQNVILIGLIARFHPIKDHSSFLQAASVLKSKFPQVEFLLCGDDICTDNLALNDLLRQYDLQGRIHLLGSRSDVPRIMASLDIHCLTSTSEASPNVVGEAMACAVPCVVTDVGDSARLVGDTGYVVPSGDSRAISNACIQLVEMETELRKELGTRARQRIRDKFDLEYMLQCYFDTYESVARKLESKTTYSLAT